MPLIHKSKNSFTTWWHDVVHRTGGLGTDDKAFRGLCYLQCSSTAKCNFTVCPEPLSFDVPQEDKTESTGKKFHMGKSYRVHSINPTTHHPFSSYFHFSTLSMVCLSYLWVSVSLISDRDTQDWVWSKEADLEPQSEQQVQSVTIQRRLKRSRVLCWIIRNVFLRKYAAERDTNS